ncbi:hypothetical protein GQ600_10614 [Phytophthora cactorum]|nr:hypothetical protein GQ600_10614 [Phytophthora cactorum]
MSGFRARWRELLREGWKSKVPTGLSNDYTNLIPGKTKKDVGGVGFFRRGGRVAGVFGSNCLGQGGIDLMVHLHTADTACANDKSSNAAASSSQDPAVATNLAAEVGGEDVDDDPNFIAPGDNPADFAALDSEGENENTSVYDDDEDLGLGEADSAVEDAAADPDLHFEPRY